MIVPLWTALCSLWQPNSSFVMYTGGVARLTYCAISVVKLTHVYTQIQVGFSNFLSLVSFQLVMI